MMVDDKIKEDIAAMGLCMGEFNDIYVEIASMNSKEPFIINPDSLRDIGAILDAEFCGAFQNMMFFKWRE